MNSRAGDQDPDQEPEDALDLIGVQDRTIAELFERWDARTEELKAADSVDARYDRGSVVKLLLQHLAVRESAKQEVSAQLHAQGNHDLGDQLEGDGIERRQQIAHLDELVRGVVGINANNPDIDRAVLELEDRFRRENQVEPQVLEAAHRELGPSEQRDLPSPEYVRKHSPTHPSPVPKWHDQLGPLKAIRALYDHLRGSPGGGTKPGLDEAREQTPGLSTNKPGSESH